MRAPALAFGAMIAVGCRDRPESAKTAPVDAAQTACEPRVAEKLGVSFVRICASDLGFNGAAFEPFWISATPLGCSAGEHETVRCPSIVALAHPAPGESRGPRSIKASAASVIDSDIAHRICTMRFNGRLPTRAERARALDAMGMATVLVVANGEPPTSFELRPLAEWVTEVPCDTPSVLDRACRAGPFPSTASARVPWSSVVACDAHPLEGSSGAVELGASCPVTAWEWSSERLPCAIRSPAGPAAKPIVPSFSLDCRKPSASDRHPADDADVAAFRCVLPNGP